MNEANAQAEASRLLREARDHKRASRQHRMRARELMEQLNGLIAACAARGVRIQINTEPEGGHGGHTNQARAGAREPAGPRS